MRPNKTKLSEDFTVSLMQPERKSPDPEKNPGGSQGSFLDSFNKDLR
jgi:hypothetical protein